jgi:hypothetical protein
MIDAHMNPATFEWDRLEDSTKARQVRIVDPSRYGDPLQEMNRDYLYELGTVYGQEGTDWQNPNAWQGTGVLVFPSEHTSGLRPTFGVDGGQSPADIALNVQTTRHLAVIDERNPGY